jgi:hypothetical protein
MLEQLRARRRQMHYLCQMRRSYIWYGLALGWGIAALAGLLRHHAPQAWPAALFAVFFAILGVWIGRRDENLRRQRTPKFR